MSTVALNDLHVMDVRNRTWASVAMFAEEVPDSRWGHSLVASREKLLLFGGMNLNAYCESVVFELILNEDEIRAYLQTKTS